MYHKQSETKKNNIDIITHCQYMFNPDKIEKKNNKKSVLESGCWYIITREFHLLECLQV